ncbi:hypothetical protein PMAYCL1PPCAC_05084, partial [Pristionchus mayeri]
LVSFEASSAKLARPILVVRLGGNIYSQRCVCNSYWMSNLRVVVWRRCGTGRRESFFRDSDSLIELDLLNVHSVNCSGSLFDHQGVLGCGNQLVNRSNILFVVLIDLFSDWYHGGCLHHFGMGLLCPSLECLCRYRLATLANPLQQLIFSPCLRPETDMKESVANSEWLDDLRQHNTHEQLTIDSIPLIISTT